MARHAIDPDPDHRRTPQAGAGYDCGLYAPKWLLFARLLYLIIR